MRKKPTIILATFLLLVGCGVSSSSIDLTFDASWQPLFAEGEFSRFSATPVTPSSTQENVGIEIIYQLNANDEIKGFAFQATVDGNGGRKSIVFRLTIYENKYQGFEVLSHREHGGFGVLQFNALLNDLPGTNANFSLVEFILINANAGRTGISQTYDGVMPAIQAMTQQYLGL
jgi:hypothetical protein